MATATPEAPPRLEIRGSGLIGHDALELSDTAFDEYAGLLLKAAGGDRNAMALAKTYHPNAGRDMMGIRECQQRLQQLEAAQSPKPLAAHRKLEDELVKLDSEIEAMKARTAELVQQIHRSTADLPDPRSIRHAVKMAATNAVVSKVLADELAAAGCGPND